MHKESLSPESAGLSAIRNPCENKHITRARRSLHAVLAVSAAALIMMCGTGCGKNGGAEGQQAHSGNGNGRPGRHGPKQLPIPVVVESAHNGPIASHYTATATLTAEKEAEVLARVTGVVESLGCEEGDVVKRGSVLLQIENDEYLHRLQQAEANTASVTDRYNRLDGMVEQQLVSAEEFEGIKNELKAAKAAEALARLNLSYTTVGAPFEGRVVRRLVDVGQNVNVGTALFGVSDFDPLLAVVHVPSKEFKKLKPDQPVRLVLDSNDDQLQGRIKLVSPIINPASGTIKITIEIREYPPNTRPGDFAEVLIVTERRENRTLVPKNAVFTDRGDQIVYVAADSTAERRVVEAGFEDGTYTEILSGVTEGEAVVVKGQRSLKHGAPIKILVGGPPGPARGDEGQANESKGDSTRSAKTEQAGS